MGGGVGEPGPVDEQPQVVRAAEVADRAQLLQGVAGAEFGGLGDGHRPGLSVVLVASSL